MSRTALSPGQLYALLNDQWLQRRPAGCARCRMPLPIAIERRDADSPNWRIGAAPWCAYRCHYVIAEIAALFWPLHDLAEYDDGSRDEASGRSPRGS